jgi:hypothetical protein
VCQCRTSIPYSPAITSGTRWSAGILRCDPKSRFNRIASAFIQIRSLVIHPTTHTLTSLISFLFSCLLVTINETEPPPIYAPGQFHLELTEATTPLTKTNLFLLKPTTLLAFPFTFTNYLVEYENGKSGAHSIRLESVCDIGSIVHAPP